MKSQYDVFAHEFSQTRQNAWPEFEILKRFIKKQERVLDLGCGNGRLREFLTPEILNNGNYFGVDNSRNLLDIAREKFPRDYFFYADFSKKLPFGDDNFQTICAIASFHHLLNKKDQQLFLSEAHRILAKDGILFFTTWKLPMKYAWKNILQGRWKNWIIPFGINKHERIYRRIGKTELKKLVQKSGFKILKIELSRKKNWVVIAQKNLTKN